MFTSPGVARVPRTEQQPCTSELRRAIVAPAPAIGSVLLNRLLRMVVVLLALASTVLLVAAVLLG